MKLVIAQGARLGNRAACARLSPLLRTIAAGVPPRGSSVEVNWIGERMMTRLNRSYKKRTGAAEILTFPCHGPDPAREAPIGEIYLCRTRVLRGARRRRVSVRSYAARLLVHGLFHLRGHRHDDARSEARMEAAEERLLLALLPRGEVERLFE
ncbi:MAG: rRNA maturation RNase YbeY [Candidatus Krumholzibacteria bacterium]|nr:rRNA maturation RNase YbeY [Candidatus Krumholzibacteria bacterium]